MKHIQTFESFLREGSVSMYISTVQAALKQLGYDVKQSDLKVGVKKEKLYDLVLLNGETLCSSSDYAQMVTWIQNAVKEDPTKYGLDPKVLESVNEADMTKFYDGFVMYDMKSKKEFKSRYIKGIKNNVLEDEIIKKLADKIGSTPSSIGVGRFIKKGEWDKVDKELEEIKR